MGDAGTADRIVRQGGNFAYRWSGAPIPGTWTGLLEDNGEMIPGKAYWYVNLTGANRDIVLAGEVDNAGNYGTASILAPPAVPANGSYANAYSWRDSRIIPMDSLGFTIGTDFIGGDASTSDRIVSQHSGGGLARYLTLTSEWDGQVAIDGILPGNAYWIVNRHSGHPWDYTYVGAPVLPVVARDHEGVVTSVRDSQKSSSSKASDRSVTSVKGKTKTKQVRSTNSSK
jgi:hypothetical protein